MSKEKQTDSWGQEVTPQTKGGGIIYRGAEEATKEAQDVVHVIQGTQSSHAKAAGL